MRRVRLAVCSMKLQLRSLLHLSCNVLIPLNSVWSIMMKRATQPRLSNRPDEQLGPKNGLKCPFRLPTPLLLEHMKLALGRLPNVWMILNNVRGVSLLLPLTKLMQLLAVSLTVEPAVVVTCLPSL